MILREVLHAHIPTLNTKSTVRDAVDRMDVYQFPALVVVNDDLAPTHVITEGDIARAVTKRGNLTDLCHEKASHFASADPVTAGPDLEIGDALHLMLSRGLTVLPIIETARLIGIVLRVDLMQAMLMDIAPET